MSGCSAEWRPRAGYFIISYDIETLLAEAGAEVPGPCPIVADALAGLTEPQYSMLLLGPGPSSRSLRDSPSAEFRSSSTPDNSELMNCWRNGRGFASLLIPKCSWQRLPVLGRRQPNDPGLELW